MLKLLKLFIQTAYHCHCERLISLMSSERFPLTNCQIWLQILHRKAKHDGHPCEAGSSVHAWASQGVNDPNCRV